MTLNTVKKNNGAGYFKEHTKLTNYCSGKLKKRVNNSVSCIIVLEVTERHHNSHFNKPKYHVRLIWTTRYHQTRERGRDGKAPRSI